ncbi:hypothetical protein [Amorphus sp. 3PC139-8]|uniref:hypothetical protein n=1 Tax=Amorphus sp. 3PC139-8 TaxID=2735676 RepID=UPI00345C8476
MIDLSAPLETWMPTVWYGGFLLGLPDLCVGQWPQEIARAHGQAWKVWIVTNATETQRLTHALSKPVPRKGPALDFASGPDAAIRKPIRHAEDFVALYAPPAQAWPWITLVSLTMSPQAAAELGAARGRYTWDADDSENAALDRVARLRARLPNAPVHVPDGATSH